MQMLLLIPAKSKLGLEFAEQAAGLPLSILELLKSLDPEAKVSVQSYDEPIDSTFLHAKEVSVESLIARQSMTSEERGTPLNCLDLQNLFLQDLTPKQIARIDLYRRSLIEKGKTARVEFKVDKDGRIWLLVSEAGGMSVVHIDAGGAGTWIRILQGEKIWFFGNGVTEATAADLARIMPPGIPHAVYTPVDCLAIGGFFLSPPEVSTSLRVLLFLDENPHCTNDDPLSQTWEAYTVYFRDLMRETENDETKKTELARECELFQWSLEAFLGKKPNASPKTRWTKDWKAFEKLVREENWVKVLKKTVEALDG